MFKLTELQTGFDKMKFVGTLRKEGITVALVQTEGQMGHIVKVGTLIGPNLGIVKTVDENKIVILERYRNYLGEILSRPRYIEFEKNPLHG
jgi:Tfp pilus assembly protein PilP